MTRRALIQIALLLLLWPGPAAAEKVRLAVPATDLSVTPVYLAQALGLFAVEGVEVDLVVTQGGGLDIKALAARQVEFAFTSGDAVLPAALQSPPLTLVFSGLHRPIFSWVMTPDAAQRRGLTAGSPLEHKLRGLKGLTLGVPHLGTLPQALAEYRLHKAGVTPGTDVKIVAVGTGPAWLGGLEDRKADVIVGAAPQPEMAVARGKAVLLLRGAGEEDPRLSQFLMGNLVVRREALRRHPETVRRLVRAMYLANRWALANPPERVAEALQPFQGRIEPAVLVEGVKAVLPALTPNGRTTEQAVEVTSEVLERAGLLLRRIPYSELATNEFVPG